MPRSAPVRPTPTRARSCVAPRRSRRRTAASRTSPTWRPKGSACACSSAAPGGSPATAASTPTARATRRCVPARSRLRRPAVARRRSRPCRRPAAPIARRSRRIRSPSRSRRRSTCACAPRRRFAHPDVKVTEAFVRAQREHKVLVTSDGAEIEQELVECGGGIDALAASDGGFQMRCYPSAHGGSSRAGRLGVRREPRARARGTARRRAGCCAPARRRVPAGRDDRRDRRRADGAAGARVGRASDRARPRLRERGVVRRHELPQARRPRLASLRLGPDEHHRRLDDARRARHVRLRRRRRARAARADRRGRRAAQLLDVARDGRDARRRRGRLDARRRLEPHAADPDDEPPPRAGRGVVRGPARRRRRRDLPRDEQELVDRRQAAQLPVRDADRLGDQERQARADAPRRDLHGHHAGVLGLARRGRRARGVAHAGPDELRQGTARAGRARLARRFPVPLPRRAGRASKRERRRAGDRCACAASSRRRRRGGARPLRALRARAVRVLGGAPADADRELRGHAARDPRRQDRHLFDEPARRRRARSCWRNAPPRPPTARSPRKASPGCRARCHCPRSKASTRPWRRSGRRTRRDSRAPRSTRRPPPGSSGSSRAA